MEQESPSALTGKLRVEGILHTIIGNCSRVLEATSQTLVPPESPSQNTDGGAREVALRQVQSSVATASENR